MCSSFFQSLSEAPPRAMILFCLTPRSRGCMASFCVARFLNNVPISESWRKERAEEGEQIKGQRDCKRAFAWWGGRVNPHHPKAHGMEETMLSRSSSHAVGGTWLWASAPPCRGVMLGVSRASQAPGHPVTGKVVVCAMHMLGSKTTMTGIEICPLSPTGGTPLHPTPAVPTGHIHGQAMAGAGRLTCSVLARNLLPGHCKQNDAPYQSI